MFVRFFSECLTDDKKRENCNFKTGVKLKLTFERNNGKSFKIGIFPT